MKNIIFAAIAPHPPIILPSVGSEEDRVQVKKTIDALENLGKNLEKKNPDSIIISSPHPDWGFNVPLHFLAKDFKGEIKNYLTDLNEPEFHFEKGKQFYANLENKKYSLIASGDLSHCLKKQGPYGFHADGPKFDKALINYLKKKDIKNILELNEKFPQASECGLRSFSFILGILEASEINWNVEILSYESPFGVGYLVADFKL
jgi:aromatic ring-opening dioxygenase LigB subunit